MYLLVINKLDYRDNWRYIKNYGKYSMTKYQKRTLELYHTKGIKAAWKYWTLTGHQYCVFLGEVSSNDFITGENLAISVGITQGNLQHNDTPWLKFILDNEIIYIPKKPIRNTISWEHIYQAGAVYGTGDNGLAPSGGNRIQDASVMINGNEYKVTLLKGSNIDMPPDEFVFDPEWTHGSEWNKLIYPIHCGQHTDSRNPRSSNEPYNQWGNYTDEDLLLDGNSNEGSFSWSQERTQKENMRVIRSYYGVTTGSRGDANSIYPSRAWRPALRFSS